MQERGFIRANSELKELVAEASHALAQLDASRLEELALSCHVLNRSLSLRGGSAADRARMAREASEAAPAMQVFARVLEATRANSNVMNRLRELRMARLEYSERQVSCRAGTEDGHGDH